jgi:hypothetical protein
MPVTVQITDDKNPKQVEFFNTALEAVHGDNAFRYLWYGGAIRGGKTFIELALLVIFCKLFPGSRWHVLRKSFDRHHKTTLPSMNKILGKANVRWNRDEGNYYVEFNRTGSRIYFCSENFKQDPALTWMLGVETNGWLLEQVEELQDLTFEMAKSRLGSWYVEPMPFPIIMGSFNPTLTWIKQLVYDKWKEGALEAPHYFLEALPDDNAWVTAAQWEIWEHLPPEMKARFIEANWDFAKPPNRFAYSFDEKVHHLDCGYKEDFPLYVSFDFNVEPIVCLLEQHDDFWNFSHTFKEYRLLNSDIYELTEQLIVNHRDAFFQITGDASGRNRTALKKNLTYYKVIRQQLVLSPNQLTVPKANPSVRNTRVLSNALLAKHPDYKINTKACPHLTLDLNGVTVGENGDIDKDKDKRMTHLLDAWRYNNWTWHRHFIDNAIYQAAETD